MELKPQRMLDTSSFLADVDKFAKETGTDYMDAIIHIAEERGLEIESVASIVKGSPKAKAVLQESAEKLNYLPKVARLPV
jgi:hypothetical protein